MERIYSSVIKHHLEHYDQMAFVSGPRQVGKTTISKNLCQNVEYSKYVNWDRVTDRTIILGNEEELIKGLPVEAILHEKPLIVFDEIHKYKQWKNYLKGFVDEYKGKLNIIVTGSAKLNIYRRGGDSLMGRYFIYRVHPLSVGELQSTSLVETIIKEPKKIDETQFAALFHFGGFPEPFIEQSDQFYHRWQLLRQEQFLKEDLTNSEKIQDLAQLQVLAELLKHQATKQVVYSELAKKVRVADTTIRRWVNILESYYYCFSLKPWTKNVSRSLLKEPKVYLWDWSVIEDLGAKVENFVGCHLLKAIHYWQDMGLGTFELFFVRDKDKREVDFLLVKNGKPWTLIEVKHSGKESLSQNLKYFSHQLNVQHSFQVAFDMPYIDKDCFAYHHPVIISLKTFLSQLI